MLRYTNVPSGTKQLIANGETIEITKTVMASFFGNGLVTLYEADGTTIITQIRFKTSTGPNPTFETTINWLAHKGLTVETGGTCFFTVWYNQGGA